MHEQSHDNDIPLLLALLTKPATFVGHVIDISPNFPTYRHAYEHVEQKLQARTGQRHYTDYASFKVAKHRQQRPTKNQNQLSFF